MMAIACEREVDGWILVWRKEYHEMLREETLEEGVQIGIGQGIEQTIRSMLADKLPIDKIVLYTGYDIEKIERIEKEIVGV